MANTIGYARDGALKALMRQVVEVLGDSFGAKSETAENNHSRNPLRNSFSKTYGIPGRWRKRDMRQSAAPRGNPIEANTCCLRTAKTRACLGRSGGGDELETRQPNKLTLSGICQTTLTKIYLTPPIIMNKVQVAKNLHINESRKRVKFCFLVLFKVNNFINDMVVASHFVFGSRKITCRQKCPFLRFLNDHFVFVIFYELFVPRAIFINFGRCQTNKSGGVRCAVKGQNYE